MRQQKYFNNPKVQNPRVKNRRDADKLINAANKVTLLLVLTVLKFKFGFGKVRLDRFIEHYNDLLDSYNKGYITVDDLNTDLFENTGMKVF
jgi:hypothetical protein